MTRQITVYPSPEARFSYNPIYQYYPSSTISLVNETSAGSYQYEWDFDDGTISTQRDPGSYTYPHWGEYNIQMKASSNQCADSITHWIKIFPPQPIADFTPDIDTGCVPLTISFTNHSIYGEEYLWEFDDGGTSTSFEPNHTFYEAGYYQVKLTVTGEGGVDYAFHEVQVFVLPEINFTVEPTLVMLPDQPAKVFNFSKYGTSYRWDFGDGTVYHAKDTSHQYTELGVYDITLTGWTEHGCEAFLNLPEAVTVIGKGIVMFPNAFKPSASGPTGGWYNPNDPSNEIFFPYHDGVIDYELIIYNRWGELVFETNDVNQGWDGYCGSRRCAEAVYVWRVKVRYSNGQQQVLHGDVTLFHKE
jgi:PKD repeat protein